LKKSSGPSYEFAIVKAITKQENNAQWIAVLGLLSHEQVVEALE